MTRTRRNWLIAIAVAVLVIAVFIALTAWTQHGYDNHRRRAAGRGGAGPRFLTARNRSPHIRPTGLGAQREPAGQGTT